MKSNPSIIPSFGFALMSEIDLTARQPSEAFRLLPLFNRLNQSGIVQRRRVDRPRNRVHFKRIIRAGSEQFDQFQGVARGRGKPPGFLFRRQNHRHPIVNRRGERIRFPFKPPPGKQSSQPARP